MSETESLPLVQVLLPIGLSRIRNGDDERADVDAVSPGSGFDFRSWSSRRLDSSAIAVRACDSVDAVFPGRSGVDTVSGLDVGNSAGESDDTVWADTCSAGTGVHAGRSGQHSSDDPISDGSESCRGVLCSTKVASGVSGSSTARFKGSAGSSCTKSAPQSCRDS